MVFCSKGERARERYLEGEVLDSKIKGTDLLDVAKLCKKGVVVHQEELKEG